MRCIEAAKVAPLVRLLLMNNKYADAIIREIQEIVDAHTIEAEPVRYGRWKPTAEYDSCYCSRCLKQYTGFFASDWNYCPNCGADMRGTKDE